MNIAQTHNAFRAAHKIARIEHHTGKAYRACFVAALRSAYRPTVSAAIKALVRTESKRVDRAVDLVVRRVKKLPGRFNAVVYNPMQDKLYQTVLYQTGECYCTCPDHQWHYERSGPCKHAIALASAVVHREDI